MPSRPASRKLWKPPERVATPTAARPAQRNCALGPKLLGLNWGTSGRYWAANPNYQNYRFSTKMRRTSVLCAAANTQHRQKAAHNLNTIISARKCKWITAVVWPLAPVV